MTVSKVRETISNVFTKFVVPDAQYLRCGQDNIMLLNSEQELDGEGVITLQKINMEGQGGMACAPGQIATAAEANAVARGVLWVLSIRFTDVVEQRAELHTG